jgi:UDP-N-acetylmuramate--alanine ligase
MKVFCIGIGGIGLSGIAQMLQAQGHQVSGVDSTESDITKHLSQIGISVIHSHSGDNITADLDLVIYSEAIPESNPERQRAVELNIRSINYAESLAEVSHNKKVIAITGTHGKTTVTGMLTSIFLEANLDPSIIIGSKIDKLNNQNFRIGQSDIFLCEACEYRDNFLHLNPHIVLITNLEPDHLDYFKTAENYYASYQKLIEKIPKDGFLIMRSEDQERLKLSNLKGQLVTYTGHVEYKLNVPGEHNRINAHSAAVLSKTLGLSQSQIEIGLKNFNGTWRRFEYKGTVNGAIVYDDYGHHPTEIKATIQAASEWHPDKKLTVIFQPHQYSRTHLLLKDFAESFTGADQVWITDIYKVRDAEEDVQKVNSQKLVDLIKDTQAEHKKEIEITELINSQSTEEDVYLIMGAGNITNVNQNLNFDT